jgi:hypothetical protein
MITNYFFWQLKLQMNLGQDLFLKSNIFYQNNSYIPSEKKINQIYICLGQDDEIFKNFNLNIFFF